MPAIPPPPRAVIDAPVRSRQVAPSFMTWDPGLSAKSGTGWSRFTQPLGPHFPHELESAGVIVVRGTTLEEKLSSLRNQAQNLLVWDEPRYIEHMRIYPGPRQKGDQNDLVELAVAEGLLISIAREFTLVPPHTWTGTVPKEKRAAWIMGDEDCKPLLNARERAILDAIPGKRVHNAIDAVGIGLWVTGRFPGGSR